jgi:hypothetical protein
MFIQIPKSRAGGVAQVRERLPSKHEALSTNPSTNQKKKGVTNT